MNPTVRIHRNTAFFVKMFVEAFVCTDFRDVHLYSTLNLYVSMWVCVCVCAVWTNYMKIWWTSSVGLSASKNVLCCFFSLCLICCLLSQYIVLSSLSLSLCFLSSLTLIYLRSILLFLSVPYPYVYRTFRFPSKQILCQWIFAIVMYVWWEAAKKFTKITLFHIIYPKHTTECMKKSPHHQSSIVWYSFT